MKCTLHLLFDLDDTLIHCNKYFDMVIDEFAEMMADWFAPYRLTKDQIKKKQQEYDLAGIQISGFSADRFPESFVECYEYFSNLHGRFADPTEKDQLRRLGYSVYESDFELYPDVLETLNTLQEEGHVLYLYTGGVREIQTRKVEKVQLTPFFEDRIFVARHKNSKALERILTTMRMDRNAAWMIGNSLRTDIAPALACGIGAIYIPPLSNWAFDMIDLPDYLDGRMIQVESIREVPEALRLHYA